MIGLLARLLCRHTFGLVAWLVALAICGGMWLMQLIFDRPEC